MITEEEQTTGKEERHKAFNINRLCFTFLDKLQFLKDTEYLFKCFLPQGLIRNDIH